MAKILKSIYTNKEKETIVKNVTRPIEKLFKIKRSGWARWITKNGYLFYLDFFFVADENRISLELCVKPEYVDDLLWKILEFSKPLQPYSLRIMGGLAVSFVEIFKTKFNINGDEGYDESNLASLYTEIFTNINQEIDKFLHIHPNADKFYYHNKKWTDQTLPIMILCHNHKYEKALIMLNKEMAKGHTGGTDFLMSDGSWKCVYKFVKEYCLKQLEIALEQDES